MTDPMKECCPRCLIDLEYKGAKQCRDNDCECHNPSPAGWEPEIDYLPMRPVTRATIKKVINRAFAHRDAALVEKVRGMKAATTNVEGDPHHYKLGYRDALDAVISLITERERI